MTSYRAEGTVVTGRRAIARRYLRSMFPFDLAATLPLELPYLMLAGLDSHTITIALFLRLLRLLRIVRLFVILKRWEAYSRLNPGILRIGRFLAAVVLLTHWIACAWFLVPSLESFPAASWAAREGIAGLDAGTQYTRSLYWAIVTMTTVGYGDITPTRNVEYLFTIVVMILGASVYAFAIANIASLLSNLDAAKTAYWNRIEIIRQHLRSRNAPLDVTAMVRNYYEHVWARYRGLKEEDLFADLPAPLRLEVLLHLTRALVDNVPLFTHCSPALRNELLLALKPQIFAPGGFIAREGEAGHEIYFISRGTIEITSADGSHHYGTLTDGDYFGDLSMILKEKRTASARARTYCDVFILKQQDFERIKSEYPELRTVLKTISSSRTEQLSKLILEGVVL